MITDKQLRQIHSNLKTKNPPTVSRLTDSPETEIPEETCECGAKITFKWAGILNRWLRLGCKACEERLENERAVQDRQQEQEFMDERFKKAIPALYHSARMDDLSQKLQSAIATAPFKTGLLLWGGVGVGKTHAASAFAYELIQQGKDVRRIRFKDLLLNIRKTFDGTSTEADVYHPLLSSDVLILEDVATGKASEFTTDVLLHVLDERLERCKQTIITTNLSLEALEKMFGQRVGSRLSTFGIVKLGGKDKRK